MVVRNTFSPRLRTEVYTPERYDHQEYWLWDVRQWLMIATQGRDGVVIVKTTQAILVGHYKDGQIAGNAAQTVEQLADYLISTGY